MNKLFRALTANDILAIWQRIDALRFDDGITDLPGTIGGNGSCFLCGNGTNSAGGESHCGGVTGARAQAICTGDDEDALRTIVTNETAIGQQVVGID